MALRIAVAIILLQTLFFKFSAHQDSVFIFTKLGLEPWGRIGELIASILLFVPRRIGVGAGLSAGLMSGAIKMHFTKIWIKVNGDGGSLFFTSIFTLILSLTILVKNRKDLPFLNL